MLQYNVSTLLGLHQVLKKVFHVMSLPPYLLGLHPVLVFHVMFGLCLVADSWPRSLDDTWAKEDLGWKPDYGDLGKMVKDAVENMPSE